MKTALENKLLEEDSLLSLSRQCQIRKSRLFSIKDKDKAARGLDVPGHKGRKSNLRGAVRAPSSRSGRKGQ